MAARSSRSAPLRAVLVALAFNACGGDGDRPTDQAQVQIRDSAGVRIVEYAETPDSTPPFRFSDEPIYRHGDRPGDYQFRHISFMQGRFLPDGGAVISDGDNSEVVLLGPDGALEGILARRGEGPGEVLSAMPLVLSRDSIVVHDGSNRRFRAVRGRGCLLPPLLAEGRRVSYRISVGNLRTTMTGTLSSSRSMNATRPPGPKASGMAREPAG